MGRGGKRRWWQKRQEKQERWRWSGSYMTSSGPLTPGSYGAPSYLETLGSHRDSLNLAGESFQLNTLEHKLLEEQKKRGWQQVRVQRLRWKLERTEFPTPFVGQTELRMGEWMYVEQAPTLCLRGEWWIIKMLLWA